MIFKEFFGTYTLYITLPEVQVPPEKVVTKVLVTPERYEPIVKEVAHFETQKIWVADPVGENNNSGNANTVTEETSTSEAENSKESISGETNNSGASFSDKLVAKILENEKISSFVNKTLENEFIYNQTIKSIAVKNKVTEINQKIEEAMATPTGQSVMNGLQIGAGVLMIIVPLGLTGLSAGAGAFTLPLVSIGTGMVMEGTIDQIELLVGKDLFKESNPGRLVTGTIGEKAGKVFGGEEGAEIGRVMGESAYDALELTAVGYTAYLISGGGNPKPTNSASSTDDIIASSGDDVATTGTSVDDVISGSNAKTIPQKLTQEGQVPAIGKMKDLTTSGSVVDGEFKVADYLLDMGKPKANWKQNSGILRSIMNEKIPIKDVSMFPMDNAGFLGAERNLLQSRGWEYLDGYWYPSK